MATSKVVAGVAIEADNSNRTTVILKDVKFDLMKANGIGAKGNMNVVVRFAQREESLSMKAA